MTAKRSDRLRGTLGEVIIEPGGAWLVAGTVFAPDEPPVPTLWQSADGLAWTDQALPSEGGARLQSAATAGDTMAGAELAVLQSPDGRHWQVAESAERLVNEDTGVGIADAAVGSGGAVMVGAADGINGRSGAVWFAPEGEEWSRVGTFDEDDDVAVNGVALDGAGFVAVGHEVVDGLRQPRVWRSADGSRWLASP